MNWIKANIFEIVVLVSLFILWVKWVRFYSKVEDRLGYDWAVGLGGSLGHELRRMQEKHKKGRQRLHERMFKLEEQHERFWKRAVARDVDGLRDTSKMIDELKDETSKRIGSLQDEDVRFHSRLEKLEGHEHTIRARDEYKHETGLGMQGMGESMSLLPGSTFSVEQVTQMILDHMDLELAHHDEKFTLEETGDEE